MTFVFDKCCGCIDLRTGSFILGYLNLIANIIVIVLDIAIILVSRDESMLTSNKKDAAFVVFLVGCIMMLFLAVFLIFAIVLVVGLHKEKRGHVKAYLIYATILIVILVIQFVASIVLLPVKVVNIVMYVLYILLDIYFLLCLRSYFLTMGKPMRPTIFTMA